MTNKICVICSNLYMSYIISVGKKVDLRDSIDIKKLIKG